MKTDSQQVTAKSLGGLIARCVIIVILFVLSCWVLHHSWPMRRIQSENYAFTAEEAGKLKNYPEAQYAYGMRAWSRGDAQKASEFLRRALLQNPLHMDAWLRLAESEAALGHSETSREILMFVKNFTAGVYRWQWPQILLARDLGMDDVFLENANYLLDHGKLIQDTLYMLDFHYHNDTVSVVDALQSANLVLYLKWLMRWGRVDDTLSVWQQILKDGNPDQEVVLQYTHFLVREKKILKAREIWHKFNKTEGIINGGFEKEITQRGFDWRYQEDKYDNWEIRRIGIPASEPSHALQIWFAGEENISFHHLYQIVPVVPLETYHLSYRWKSKWITTDQGPYVEIYGYDQNGLRHKGPMIKGTNLWQTETLEFTPPENCNAVVVRLRRLKSGRFDSKIAGTLWLDDFKLEKIQSADYADFDLKSKDTRIP